MRAPSCLVAVGLLALAGCAQEAAPAVVPRPAPVVIELPASSAGGACRLLEFATIEQALGVRFGIAAASERDSTQTCVVRLRGAVHPELTLAVTESVVDAAGFRADLVPKGATKVVGLGSAAYRRTLPAGSGQGPLAEVGWLGAKGQLGNLQYVLPPAAERAAAEEATAGLVRLAGTLVGGTA